MIEMDGLDSAKWQKSRGFIFERANRGADFWIFFERERLLSKFWAIRPSEFDGARRKDVLLGERNEWTPV